MSRRIVVYYSLTGNTKEAAEYIAAKLGADIIRLRTVKKLLDKGSMVYMIGGMQAAFGLKPKLVAIEAELANYDEIILGTPIWASKNVPAINTFIQDSSVRSKVSGVFTLSAGGDNDKCLEILKKRLPNIRWSVALADRRNKQAVKNTVLLDKFAEEIING